MPSVNPEYLATLPDDELHALADRMGLNLPEGLDRPFVIEEILETVEEEHRERGFGHDGPGHVEVKKFQSAVRGIIPGGESPGQIRYNETMIRAIARDPAWIFAYWDLEDHVRSSLSGAEDSPRLFLRVGEITPGHERARREFFDIPVNSDDHQWYINAPHPGASYRIDLCLQGGVKPRLLAKSNIVRLPLQFMTHPTSPLPVHTQRLLILSGSGELSLSPPVSGNPSRILDEEHE